MMWASFGRAPAASTRSSAATSIPSGSSSTIRTSAPRLRSDSSVRSYVGRSTITESPSHQRVEQERVGLHRAVGDEHLLGRDAVALGDPRAQRQVADRGAVGGHAARIVGERLVGGGAQAIDVDDVERRRAAGKRDRGDVGRRLRTSATGALPASRSRRTSMIARSGALVPAHGHSRARRAVARGPCSKSRSASRLANGPAARVTSGRRGSAPPGAGRRADDRAPSGLTVGSRPGSARSPRAARAWRRGARAASRPSA